MDIKYNCVRQKTNYNQNLSYWIHNFANLFLTLAPYEFPTMVAIITATSVTIWKKFIVRKILSIFLTTTILLCCLAYYA